MNSFRKLTMSALGLSVVAMCAAAPAHAQGTGQDAFATGGALGNTGTNQIQNTQTQTTQGGLGTAPSLSGATNGTIGPQGTDATYVTASTPQAPYVSTT